MCTVDTRTFRHSLSTPLRRPTRNYCTQTFRIKARHGRGSLDRASQAMCSGMYLSWIGFFCTLVPLRRVSDVEMMMQLICKSDIRASMLEFL